MTSTIIMTDLFGMSSLLSLQDLPAEQYNFAIFHLHLTRNLHPQRLYTINRSPSLEFNLQPNPSIRPTPDHNHDDRPTNPLDSQTSPNRRVSHSNQTNARYILCCSHVLWKGQDTSIIRHQSRQEACIHSYRWSDCFAESSAWQRRCNLFRKQKYVGEGEEDKQSKRSGVG